MSPPCKSREQLAAEAAQRARHDCNKTLSSLNCRACNAGEPYPHESVDEILDRMARDRGHG